MVRGVLYIYTRSILATTTDTLYIYRAEKIHGKTRGEQAERKTSRTFRLIMSESDWTCKFINDVETSRGRR